MTPEERRACYESGGVPVDNECLTQAEAKLRRDKLQCALDGGNFVNGVCLPSITASDCTASTPGLTPGQFALTWEGIPGGAKYVVVEYTPEGQDTKVFGKGRIKPAFKPPLKVSGQKPGVTVTCTVRAVNEWGHQIGFSDTFTLTTKQ